MRSWWAPSRPQEVQESGQEQPRELLNTEKCGPKNGLVFGHFLDGFGAVLGSKIVPRTLQNWSQNGTRKRVPTPACQDGPKMVGSGPVNTPTQAPLRTCTLERLSQTSKIPKGIDVGHIYNFQTRADNEDT